MVDFSCLFHTISRSGLEEYDASLSKSSHTCNMYIYGIYKNIAKYFIKLLR